MFSSHNLIKQRAIINIDEECMKEKVNYKRPKEAIKNFYFNV